jgi:hypothetical protein
MAGAFSVALAIAVQVGISAYHMRTMPHHWFALEFGYEPFDGGRIYRFRRQYLRRAVGPFSSQGTCALYVKNLRQAACVDAVDADVRPRTGRVDKP